MNLFQAWKLSLKVALISAFFASVARSSPSAAPSAFPSKFPSSVPSLSSIGEPIDFQVELSLAARRRLTSSSLLFNGNEQEAFCNAIMATLVLPNEKSIDCIVTDQLLLGGAKLLVDFFMGITSTDPATIMSTNKQIIAQLNAAATAGTLVANLVLNGIPSTGAKSRSTKVAPSRPFEAKLTMYREKINSSLLLSDTELNGFCDAILSTMGIPQTRCTVTEQSLAGGSDILVKYFIGVKDMNLKTVTSAFNKYANKLDKSTFQDKLTTNFILNGVTVVDNKYSAISITSPPASSPSCSALSKAECKKSACCKLNKKGKCKSTKCNPCKILSVNECREDTCCKYSKQRKMCQQNANAMKRKKCAGH